MILGGWPSEPGSPARKGDADLSSRIVTANADADAAGHEAAAVEAEARKARRRADSLRKHCDDLLLELQGQLTLDTIAQPDSAEST